MMVAEPNSSGSGRRRPSRRRGTLRFTDVIPFSPGPLPRTGTFIVTNNRATVLLNVAGSGFSATPGLRSIEVFVDGRLIGTLDQFFNEPNVHESFVPRTFDLSGLSQGLHTVTLMPGPGLLTDANDRFQVTAQQLPG